MATEKYLAGSGTDSFTPSDWVTGNMPITTVTVTIPSGDGVVAARSVLGIVTATGVATLSLSAAGDGSQVPKYILVEEVDATSADVESQVYDTGCFNPDLLVFGTGHDADSVKEPLRAHGIQLKVPA